MKEPAFLALGDSYTIGEGVPDEGRWPVQLVARLRESGIAAGAPRIVATTGWTTDELSAAMDAAALQPGYALVTLLIGVNNQYRGRPATEYREQFLALLRRAAALSGDVRRVVVVSIPDWGVTAFAEGRDRAAIGERRRRQARQDLPLEPPRVRRLERGRSAHHFVEQHADGPVVRVSVHFARFETLR